MKIVSQLFLKSLNEQGVLDIIPEDFLELVSLSLNNLRQGGRSNIIYSLVKGLGTLREDESDTLFPLKRMPCGLVEYAINFFVASSPQKVCMCVGVCISSFRIYFVPVVFLCYSDSMCTYLQMKCPPDYRVWLQTMYVLFGTKFAKIFGGPLWSHAPIMQTDNLELERDHNTNPLNPINVSIWNYVITNR